MKAFSSAVGLAVGFAVLAGLAAVAYFLFGYVRSEFAELDAQVARLTAIASVVALLCSTILAQAIKSRGQVSEPGVRQQATIYEDVLRLCNASATGADTSTPFVEERARCERLLALHGSSKVIAAYNEFRQGQGSEDEGSSLLKALVMEMRTDLGTSDSFRRQSEILTLLTGEGAKAS